MNNEVIIWSPGVTLEAIEKEVILVAFRHFRGNKERTAEALGITSRTLYTKLDHYKQTEEEQKQRAENERIKREEFRARQRGVFTHVDGYSVGGSSGPEGLRPKGTPNVQIQIQNTTGASSHGGNGMEPAPSAPAQHAMPVQERKEVQAVPPGPTPQGHSRKGR